MALKTAKIRPFNGEDDKEVLAQLVTQFALLIDEVEHLFEVLEQKQKDLDKRLVNIENNIN